MIDFSQLDKTIHEKARLSIMTLLMSRDDWSFQDMKQQLGMSDGNLITHLRTLCAAGYVLEKKDESGTRPRTTYQPTSVGRKAFKDYLDLLETLVRSMRPG